MFKVYVLKSEKAQKSYVGSTNDVERRLSEHNAGYHSYTKRYKPWKVIYTEEYSTENETREREKYHIFRIFSIKF